MAKLLFHRAGSVQTSPFDEAIVAVAKGNLIKVVSPYIGLRYLQRLVLHSADWRLISDVQAWLSSLTPDARRLSAQFIEDNLQRIRHVPAVHAKTVIGPNAAYLGSANLTNAGILSRTEMGMLVDEPAMVSELHAWFDAMWLDAAAPVMAEVLAYARALDEQAAQHMGSAEPKALSFGGQRVRARLARLDSPAGAIDQGDLSEQSNQGEGGSFDGSEASGAGQVRQPHQVTNAQADQSGLPEDLLAIVAARVVTSPVPRPVTLTARPAGSARLANDLEGVVLELIETLAGRGFRLKELQQLVRASGVACRLASVYLELSRYCANLPRSVFALDTLNRLTCSGGVFRQSTALDLAAVLAPYDDFLETLVVHLSFDEARGLQSVPRAVLEGRPVWCRLWSEQLVRAGLLVRADQGAVFTAAPAAVVASVPCNLYRLCSTFEWAKRWRFFERAHKAWRRKLNASRSEAQSVPLKTSQPAAPSPTLADSPGLAGSTSAGKAQPSTPSSAAKNAGQPVSGAEPAARPATQGLSPYVYARTPFERTLPPKVASGVRTSSGAALSQESALTSIAALKYRAENVYLELLKSMKRSSNSMQTECSLDALVLYLANAAGESASFVRRVLEGGYAGFPKAAVVIQATSGRVCTVTILHNGLAAYARASYFVKNTAGKRKRGHPWHPDWAGLSSAVQPTTPKAIPPVKAKPSAKPVSELKGHRAVPSAGVGALHGKRAESTADYMSRVASIFASPEGK